MIHHTPANPPAVGQRRQHSGSPPLLLCASVVTVALLCGAQGCRDVQPQWRVIDRPGKAIVGQRNTHATSGVWVARHYGWDDPELTDKRSVAAMNLYMVEDCGGCPVPSIWHIATGLQDYLQVERVEGVEITERVRYTKDPLERADFEDYKASIDDNRPVILTFCYDAGTREDPAYARQRAIRAFSAVGIGYIQRGGRRYVICHDGFDSPPVRHKAIEDQVAAEDLGLGRQSGPWQQTGTSIYRWDGKHENVVMVFVRPAQKRRE